MAGRRKATMASAVAVALLLAMAAVSGAAAGGYTACGVDLERMKGSCGSYCARGSREARPSSQCCGALSGADFPCLCRLKGALASLGNLDAGRAMQIPSKCGIRGAPRSC
ncbi:hypothetical protein ZWY2020_027612 [Hordeum vulgare]|nr:hypothetical protein ZWY2020_027612 [Hordeum vulgare]